MIAEILQHGRENATPGRDLATMFNCNIRDITEQIERERREGEPICAASGENPGYYLGNSKELDDYCKCLEHREKELAKTRLALVKTLRGVADLASK